MKTKNLFSLFILFLISFPVVNASGSDKSEGDTTLYKSYYGKVVDEKSNTVLPFATIEAEGSNIATVSNIDGEFILKVAKGSPVNNLKVSYVGYINKSIPLSEFKDNKELSIKLQPTTVQIQAVTIRTGNAEELIAEVLKKTPVNYSTNPVMMKAFYRETIKNRRNYVSISEAVVDIFKSEYNNDMQFDQVKIEKGRKSADVEKMDTVLFKLQGGPAISLLLDIMKNPYILLTDEFREIYDFKINDVVNLDDMLHYVVFFKQKPNIDAPYYSGRIFIEMDKLAITEAEFELNLDNPIEAERIFIQKKPAGMKVVPEKAVYRTKYNIQDGKWYFSYARAEVRFKIDWEKKLFNTYYTTMSEIAITDKNIVTANKIQSRDRFKRNDILDELVYTYFDTDYWGDYNVIEPDQSIETAIRKLNRKFRVELSD